MVHQNDKRKRKELMKKNERRIELYKDENNTKQKMNIIK